MQRNQRNVPKVIDNICSYDFISALFFLDQLGFFFPFDNITILTHFRKTVTAPVATNPMSQYFEGKTMFDVDLLKLIIEHITPVSGWLVDCASYECNDICKCKIIFAL